MTTKSFAQIMTVTVFIPVSARNWETRDLPVSKNLKLLFNNYQYETLEDLQGKNYGELFVNAIFNQRFITELFELLNLFTSADGFRTLEFQVSIAKQKRIVAVEFQEDSTTGQNIDSLNITDNEYDISQSYPHTVEKAINQQNEAPNENQNDQYENILEITDIATKHLISGHSTSHEFKNIFELMEIDETSDFLQLKSENTNTQENDKLPEITGDEIISIPVEYRNVLIFTLDVSVRLDNVLRSLNVQTLGDLDGKFISEIKHTKNCGKKTVDELYNLVKKLGNIVKNERFEETDFTNKENKKIVVPESLEKLPIKNLELSVRLTNVLDKLNIVALADLKNFSFAQIKNTESCGSKTVDELRVLVDKFQDEIWVNETVERNQYQLIISNEKENVSVPSSIRDIPTNCFALSTRLSNVLKDLNIITLGDLEQFSIQDIKQTKNFGKKTLEELRAFVYRIGRASNSEDLIEAKTDKLPSELNLNNLLGFVNSFLDELPPREREIFTDRYGGALDGKIPTLEELGEKFAVTRERIRQIESKISKKLISRLTGVAEKALKEIKHASEKAVCPVSHRFLTYLTRNDYELFVYPPNFYLHLLKKLSPEIFIAAGSQTPVQCTADISVLSRKIKSILDEEIHFLPLPEVFERLLSYQAFDEFTINDFFEAIRDKNFTIEYGDTPDVILIATDKNKLTMTEMAWQVLRDSNRPLLPEEIIEEAKNIFGAEIEIHSERSLANLPSYDQRFYLLDRRTIGLRRHFKLPEEKWSEVTGDIYKLLSERLRPVSTTEVINEHLFEWTVQTTPGETTEILREDPRFKDLGRFLFALSEWEIEEREPVKDLVVRVLMETDDALTATEIGDRIQKYRSVSTTSMPTILREHPELKIFDFGSVERSRITYYGLKMKGDYRKFFATNEIVLKRLIKKFFPIKFADLCEKLGFDADDELAEKMWLTIQAIPELRFTPVYRSPETVIKFSHWHLKSRS